MKIGPDTVIPFSALDDIPSEVRKYLEPTQYIESDNTAFKDVARNLREKAKDVQGLIYLIHNFTANHLTYIRDPKTVPENASAFWAYTSKKGDCTQFSRLMVALLRAARIPARTLSGLGVIKTYPNKLYTSEDYSNPPWHAWTELYLPSTGWIPVEPQSPLTFGYTLSSHIIFMLSYWEYTEKFDGYDCLVDTLWYRYSPSGSISVKQDVSHMAFTEQTGSAAPPSATEAIVGTPIARALMAAYTPLTLSHVCMRLQTIVFVTDDKAYALSASR